MISIVEKIKVKASELEIDVTTFMCSIAALSKKPEATQADVYPIIFKILFNDLKAKAEMGLQHPEQTIKTAAEAALQPMAPGQAAYYNEDNFGISLQQLAGDEPLIMIHAVLMNKITSEKYALFQKLGIVGSFDMVQVISQYFPNLVAEFKPINEAINRPDISLN